jgi:hypothetical protein
MPRLIDAPEHWRERAEEMITFADQTNDRLAKETLLDIAAGYELLARRAEQRLAEALRRQKQSAET